MDTWFTTEPGDPFILAWDKILTICQFSLIIYIVFCIKSRNHATVKNKKANRKVEQKWNI